MKSVSPGELRLLHTSVMKVVEEAVTECRGVFDGLHGDRVVITFNASTNCATHVTKAAQLIVTVRETLRTKQVTHFKGIRFGAATGKALCGNLGADRVKRFSTVGSIVNQAYALLSLCRKFNRDNLTTAEAIKSMQYDYQCCLVSIASIPHTAEPVLFGTVLERKSTKSDEWMYELQEGDTTTGPLDPVRVTDAVLEAISNGKFHEASEKIKGLLKGNIDAASVSHLEELVSNAQSGRFPEVQRF
jgi:hypothetical protein